MRRVLRTAPACGLAWLLAAQTAVLQIRVLHGEGAVQTTGSRVPAAFSVVVTDEIGQPVEGAVVSFRLPDQGPSGDFGNGLKTEIVKAGLDGRASVPSIRWNATPGPVSIRVTAVKDQARAGLVVSQYLAGAAPGRKSAPVTAGARARSRWLIITALAASAAGAGFAAGYARNGRPGPAAAAPPVLVGPPTISIGRP
ncbi:MAG: hypothetical protein AAB225_27525 [Acidobacteriota bacterium]